MARKSSGDGESKKVAEEVRYWLGELDAAKRREKDYRIEGKRIREIYSGEKESPYNVLFSNTEIMAPALYSQVPRPVVERRYKDDDALGKAAATAAQRMLEFLIDTNIEGYETFNEMMKAGTLDALLPGRGVSSIKYDAEIEGDVKQYELVCPESRSWDRVYFGYARKWSKVPWVAYEVHLDKEESIKLFGKDIANKIEYTSGEQEDEDGRTGDDRDTGERKTALTYQIWDRAGDKKVRYISPHYTDGYLKVEDDPLEITGFFNCPRPINFIDKTDDMVPTAPYLLYENQATELNKLTRRINKIIEAIKARGVYDATLGDDIANLMQADDNELVAADKSASLAAEKGMQNAIWFMPLDVLITTLSELYAAREQCKQVIYEVMGISDILRGSTKASETLGAQQIKSQWGTLRIKPKQAEVQRYARDFLRMMLEVAALKFSEDSWAKMTGLPYLTSMQVEQARQMQQALQQQVQQAQVMAQRQEMALAQQPQQANPAAPQPPQPPQPKSAQIALQHAQQKLQQLQQTVQSTPQWSAVLKLLKNDLQRSYKIDIETNSTIEPEAVEDQKNISDLMTAIGQFLNGVGPLVAQGVMPFQVAQGMLLAITRRFRFGTQIEDIIKQMQPPPQKNEAADKAKMSEQQAQEAQMQSQKIEAQATGDKIQANAQIAQLQTQLKQAQSENALQKRESDLQFRELSVKTDEQLLKMEQKSAQDTITKSSQVENSKLDHKRQLSGLEAKQAKTEQVVSKTVDSKMAQSVQQMSAMVERLVDTVSSQAIQTQELIKAVKAPRRRMAVRDKNGDLQEMRDEAMQ